MKALSATLSILVVSATAVAQSEQLSPSWTNATRLFRTPGEPWTAGLFVKYLRGQHPTDFIVEVDIPGTNAIHGEADVQLKPPKADLTDAQVAEWLAQSIGAQALQRGGVIVIATNRLPNDIALKGLPNNGVDRYVSQPADGL